MSSHLPDRPSLDHLKKQAKALLRAAHTRDVDALRRFAEHPAFASIADAPANVAHLALHDAQSVIAREHGFTSWNELRDEVVARTLSSDEAVDEFLHCATGGAAGRAKRLLARHPGIAHASLFTELVLGDVAAVDARIQARRQAAIEPGGPQAWEPLLYVCHTYAHRDGDALVAIARLLLAAGANPNAQYHWNWHPELPRTALWGALCVVRHLPLARVLLEAGAEATDGVSTHIAAGGGDRDALDLLHSHGMQVDGIPGGLPPLVYVLGWATDPTGPRWLLEHGADANLAWGDEGEAPLHVAARRWDESMVAMLAAHGADLQRRRADGQNAHTVAALSGNLAVAEWLRAHGCPDELTPLQRFVAAAARGDRAAAEAMLARQPSLRDELRLEHHLLLHRAAESGNLPMLETMVACGFDVNVADKDGVTPLHRAAMAGQRDAVRTLIAHGAAIDALDGTFAAPPLVWAAEGRSNSQRDGVTRDFVGVARALIDSGASQTWTPPEGAPHSEGAVDGLAQLCADATVR